MLKRKEGKIGLRSGQVRKKRRRKRRKEKKEGKEEKVFREGERERFKRNIKKKKKILPQTVECGVTFTNLR